MKNGSVADQFGDLFGDVSGVPGAPVVGAMGWVREAISAVFMRARESNCQGYVKENQAVKHNPKRGVSASHAQEVRHGNSTKIEFHARPFFRQQIEEQQQSSQVQP